MTHILLILLTLTGAGDDDESRSSRPLTQRRTDAESTSNESPPPMNTANSETSPAVATPLPALPQAITSFGAALVGESMYVYGGHYGKAHHYSQNGQSGQLLRLNLKTPTKWDEASSGPRLQGLAMVAHEGKLYRTGGFIARNQEDEEQDLWSVADFVRFDPRSEKWEELPAMPFSRSSFDAVMLGDVMYVAGGWELRGAKETLWQETAYAIDLSQPTLKWQQLPPPPFKRRAVSLGTIDDKVLVIGGMQPDGKVTTKTAIYNPAAGRWSEGPKLPGDDMEGFGTACCTAGERLYVSTISGKLLRLSDDRNSWQLVEKLRDDRFFHRMLPLDDQRLILLGGASMQTGKFSSVTTVKISP